MVTAPVIKDFDDLSWKKKKKVVYTNPNYPSIENQRKGVT
jgi:hypothetical protein